MKTTAFDVSEMLPPRVVSRQASAPRFRVRVLGSAAIFLGSACAVRVPPAPSAPARPALAEVTVDLGRQWTDSGVIVQKGDRLVFWATGEMHSGARPHEPAGPDGIGPSAVRVGRGGLVGRIGDGKPFDIGARTHLVWKGAPRAYRLVSPPPLEMKRDGALQLGARGWRPGLYEGTFLVSIWRSQGLSP